MKFLRNPVVVGILAVLALGLVIRNVFLPMMGGARWRGPQPQSAAATPAAAPKPASPQQPANPMAAVKSVLEQIMTFTNKPLARMDIAAVRAGTAQWVQAPKRDPFWSKNASTNSAAQLLKLTGVWRQTDGNLAVINKRLLTEGDSILDFSVEKIERDVVWVTGPNGREPLTFKLPTPIEELQPAKVAAEAER